VLGRLLVFEGLVGGDIAAAAVLFLVLAPVAEHMNATTYRLAWFALWGMEAGVLFLQSRQKGQVPPHAGTSWALGIICLIVAAIAVVAGLLLGVKIFVDLGGRL
jgi:hypothetical protein